MGTRADLDPSLAQPVQDGVVIESEPLADSGARESFPVEACGDFDLLPSHRA